MGAARARPESSKHHAVGTENRKESRLDAAADNIILSLIHMRLDVVLIFANLNELLKHRRREV